MYGHCGRAGKSSSVGGMQVGHDSGTMVAYGTGPMAGGTMVVNADASSSRAGTLRPSGTFVTAGGEAGVQGGSDYQAAVQAASQGADGSVVRSSCMSIMCYRSKSGVLDHLPVVHHCFIADGGMHDYAWGCFSGSGICIITQLCLRVMADVRHQYDAIH